MIRMKHCSGGGEEKDFVVVGTEGESRGGGGVGDGDEAGD